MKPRQLLQALRWVRHRSMATVSTSIQPTFDADLSVFDSMQKRAGVASVSRQVGGLYVVSVGGLPHLRVPVHSAPQ